MAERDEKRRRSEPDKALERRLEGAPGFERPILEMEHKIAELKTLAASTQLDLNGEVTALEGRLRKVTAEVYSMLTPWERVNVARHPDRPVTTDYLNQMFDDFVELHGDRSFADDPAIVTGLAVLEGRRVFVMGHRKGKSVKERLRCNFGCAHPEGYRKALAKMRLAEKLGLPILSLINTPGAYPGIGAEERGQARAIALNILEMFGVRVPILALVIGEGGSGGALGIGVGDRVAMLEHAYYSVISPEGCAAILYKSGDKAPEAAEALKLTAPDLAELGIIDEVVPEPLGGAHRDPQETIANVQAWFLRGLDELAGLAPEELMARRHAKYRHMGEVQEG
ncbi:MAG: acetyl-CoA carboxylase carboxyltransferase subunit alpha [Planctomycetota bacterium]